MMRVLVTGSRGLLGAAICREFAARTSSPAITRRSTSPTTLRSRPPSPMRGPDVVINCAAYNDVDGAEDDPVTALSVNAFAVETLPPRRRGARAVFVHYSSDFVFDGETERPYTEEDGPNPRSVYAASKLLGDWFALASPRAFVLRVESLFGSPGRRPSRRGSLGTIVDRIRTAAEVPVFVDRVVSPTYTHDIARATAHLLRSGAPQGLYHCVNTGHATWLEIAEHIAASSANRCMRGR